MIRVRARKMRGFTVVELLIVVTFLTLLIGIAVLDPFALLSLMARC